jgi:hypothetical protein
MPDLAPKAICETNGHLWGSTGKCITCKIDKPKPPGKLKSILGKIKDAVGNALGEAFVNR